MRSVSEYRPEHGRGRQSMVCECLRCRTRRTDDYVERLASQSLSTALRHAQDPWEQSASVAGRASTTPLPPIDRNLRWSVPASVSDIINRRAAAITGFDDKGKLRMYRITRGGKDLYFGIVSGPGQSVSSRIRDHFKNTRRSVPQPKLGESEQLGKLLQGKKTTFVRYADINAPLRYRNDPKYLHAIQVLAQNALHPQISTPERDI